MSVIPAHFMLEFQPVSSRDSVVQVGNARFTVLTSRLIRLEYHPQGCFEDRASQAFWYRHQPVPAFEVRATESGIGLQIDTDHLLLRYTGANGDGFSPDTLSIMVKATGVVWHPDDVDDQNLRGTTRTLDFANGYVPLTQGLMSRAGWSVVDDSTTLVFNQDCWLEPRIPGGTDLYFFGYGHDYKACLRDYCLVSGKPPLIPRWVLGNWWSRYWAYTQDELTSLIRDFQKHELPFSILIVDMDWHITETGNTSTGWTGYTWNRALFPDPQGFIDFAHEQGLKISLNLHPAEGIHPHEEQYEEMARCLDIDPQSAKPISFDITNPRFAEAYFRVLHHPYEAMNVDFWWVDWQQGLESPLPGLDPLWLINHLHFYDLGRNGTRRPFIFSRWGQQGHQRYPIGFSGDSYATWDTLRFLPYMTATAANVAYGWWSHDIGGHTSGVADPELFARWVQFGVFSPINRLHATKGLFYDRRPWMFEDAEILRVVREAFQLRHAFLPYLYSMAWRAHETSVPLLQPMYYDYPEADEAYACPRQYLFGSELIAAPYVDPAIPNLAMSRQVVWLPEGDWYHFFTGQHFAGNGWHALYGRQEDIPLFARAGAIVPFAPKVGWGGVENPSDLYVHVFAGASNTFQLHEDDGETTRYLNQRHHVTTFTQAWGEKWLELTIESEGDSLLIPTIRAFHIILHGVRSDAGIIADVAGTRLELTTTYDFDTETLHLSTFQAASGTSIYVRVETSGDALLSRRSRKRETVLRMLRFFRLHTGVRNHIAANLDAILAEPSRIAPYLVTMSDAQARALCETLYDAGLHVVEDTHQPTLIVLWNNHEQNAVTYRYGEAFLYFGSIQTMRHTNGVLPRFAQFTPPARQWSDGSQGQHVHRTQWQAQVDYANVFSAVESNDEQTP